MASAVAVTTSLVGDDRKVQLVQFDFTSHTDGTFGTITSINGTAASNATINLNGTLLQIAYKPGTASAGAATLKHTAGIDVFGGLLASLASAVQDTPKTTTNSFPFVLGGPYTLAGTGAGSGMTGTLWLWIR